MGTEFMRVSAAEGNDEFPPVPPGFESFASFTLKRVEGGDKKDDDCAVCCSASTGVSDSQVAPTESEPNVSDPAKLTRSLRRKPWINYGRYDDNSDDDLDSAPLSQIFSVRPSLPKGVLRGCAECNRCQKVTARWRPEESRRPDITDAPVFYPTEEEFEDTLKYIASIRPQAEQYGICRIVPPSSWKPPCPLKEKGIWESCKFATRVQRVDKLQNRGSVKGMNSNNNYARKRKRRCNRMGVDCRIGEAGVLEADNFGFEPGPEFTLCQFQKYADDFKAQYFGLKENIVSNGDDATKLHKMEPLVQDIEGEYWRMVEKPTEEIEVLYGADLETGAFGSGFPKMSSDVDSSHDKYVRSGWNLNNFSRLPGSVLFYEESVISGVVVPWLYIGMCFSSFCWHVEDHHLYSLNYMHWGAPKMWYGVPGKDATKLEQAMRKHLPDLFEEQPDLLHKLVTQLSPSILKSEGVPVYRCVQSPGEFVLTFPRAYHAGFNCGFNCAEAVNVAPVDWLPHGQIAVELYRDQGRRTSISHDKLLLGAAREAVKAHWEINLLKKNTLDNLRWKEICGKDGILAKALKARVDMERVRRECLCNSSQTLKMDSSFDANTERECFMCSFDLHLSAAGCHCSPEKYACLNHANQLCSCAWNAKFFLFRYEISELNILVEALEGKLSSIYRWARQDLGLALSSHVSRNSLQGPKLSENLPNLLKGSELKQENSQILAKTPESTQRRGVSLDFSVNSNGIFNGRSSEQEKKSSENLKDAEGSFTTNNSTSDLQMFIDSCQSKRREYTLSVSQLVSKGTLNAENLAAKVACKKSPNAKHDNIILLSDDEHDEPKKSSDGHLKTSLKHLNLSERLPGADNKADSSACEKKPIAAALTNSVVTQRGNAVLALPLFPGGQNNLRPNQLRPVKEEHDGNSGPQSNLHPSNISYHPGFANSETGKNFHNVSLQKESLYCPMENAENSLQHQRAHVKEERDGNTGPSSDVHLSNASCLADCAKIEFGKNMHSVQSARDSVARAGHVLQDPQSCGNGTYNIKDKHERMVRNTTSTSVENGRSLTGSVNGAQNHVDKCFRQKGPRIAKVVRRTNCNVEPLDYGVVISGNMWCNSRAIFPKGFRSRVMYINVLDPTLMCYYISEILDTGRGRPLFMVYLENCPSEVFVHVTATRCWDMVRERVNQEIGRQFKLGKPNLPPLQPPGSLDGFEMFGFSSPAIMRTIEAMDQNRVCVDYWDSRPFSRSQVQIPRHFQTKENSGNVQEIVTVQNDKMAPINHDSAQGVDTLRGLFKKANMEELRALYSALDDSSSAVNRSLVTNLLHEELQKLPK